MKVLQSLALAFALGAAACSDPAGPNTETRSITVNLCGLGAGTWFAYQNDGGAWTQVSPNGSGQIVFDATERVSVATASSFFGLTFTEIINATATELENTSSVSCEGDFGVKSMSGSVAGVSGEEFARISAGSATDGASLSAPGWVLEDLPDHPVDLVATRYATFSSQPAQRVVVRRSVTPNGPVSSLDFGGAESSALESAIATFTDIPAGGSLTMVNAVRTANGTNHQLGDLSSSPVGSTTQAVNYVSLPASLRIASDMHVISAAGSNVQATNTIIHYYKTPAVKTLAFGPVVSEPTITNVATSPIVRPRVELARQSAYLSAMVVEFGEAVGQASRYVAILTTAAYLGDAAQVWDVSVPDMSSAGYGNSQGLTTTTYNWSITAYGGAGGIGVLGAEPVDGATIISSTRGKVNQALAAGRAVSCAPSVVPRSRPCGKR